MAKRKAQNRNGDDEEHEQSSKKSKTSSNESFLKTANLFQRNQVLHKSLNLTLSNAGTNKNNAIVDKRIEEVSSSSSSESDEDEVQQNMLKQMVMDRNERSKGELFNPHQLSTENKDIIESESENEVQISENNLEEEENKQLMNKIEEKVRSVHILQNVKLSPIKDPKQQLVELYPTINQLNIKTNLKINENEELYLFRTPKNVDPQSLLNIDINLEGKNKIHIGEKYVIRPTPKIPHPTLVINNVNKICNFKGNIVMEKYVKPSKDPKLPEYEKSNVHFPNNLKNRHPLFGFDFEEKIQLTKEAEKKLDKAIKNLLKQQKKSKTKIIKDEMEQEKDELVFSLLNGTNESKGEENNVSTSSPISKKKKTKNEIIQESLKLLKQEIYTDFEMDEETSPVNKSKKKQKKIQIDDTFNINIKRESDDSGISVPHRKSLVNSTLLPNETVMPKFNPEVSYIPKSEISVKKEKKKSKSKSSD